MLFPLKIGCKPCNDDDSDERNFKEHDQPEIAQECNQQQNHRQQEGDKRYANDVLFCVLPENKIFRFFRIFPIKFDHNRVSLCVFFITSIISDHANFVKIQKRRQSPAFFLSIFPPNGLQKRVAFRDKFLQPRACLQNPSARRVRICQ